MRESRVFAATLSVVLTAACSDRLTAPQAVELVNTVEESRASGGASQRWLGGIWTSDLRLGAALTTELRRDGDRLHYRAIVFERVVVPGRLGNSICAGTQRSAYFWREGDGVVFFPEGVFDQRLVPALASCQESKTDSSMPLVTAVTPGHGAWIQASVEGEITPGVVTGSCRFLELEAERVLREEHGITCELTNHRVRMSALLRDAVAGSDSLRLILDSTDIIGVRYTINCDAAKSQFSVPCAAGARLRN